MKILHYSPPGKRIRFFKTGTKQVSMAFDDVEDMYEGYWNEHEFLKSLNERVNNLDVVLISAHGNSDAILKVQRGSFKRAIRLDNASLFKHNFVLANSCYTALEFGPKLLEEGALTYIGFNDSIESVFIFGNFDSKRYNESLEKIFKNLYNKCMVVSINNFVRKCQTANEFMEYMRLNFQKEIKNVMKMSIDDIKLNFHVSISEEMIEKFKAVIKLEFIGKLDILNDKITLLGEGNYIPWFF
ncbi:TPA: hypothetical protein QCY39_005213, partial [Bacillus cereus]|nr:hypothetical protein [Bacillus cereus]